MTNNPEAPPNFDIFVLGTRASGKSVLLASLFRQLSSMNGVTNFYARCDDPEQHRELCDNYDQLLDTEADWPAGTYRIDSYDMRCFHRLRGKDLEVFSIRFHDYPGGYVSNQIEQRDYVIERAEHCSSVMALIDGRKLLDRLEDRETNPTHSLHRDLDSLVRVLQQCVGKPIHFVLTKADLMPPAKYPLGDIVDELKKHRGFNDILAQQVDSGASCFLIPVSAIGPGFALLDPGDGLIKKRRNGTIEPVNLDVMISAAMVDTVVDLARNAEPEAPRQEAAEKPLMVRLKERIGNKLGYARMAAPAALPLFGALGVLGIIGVALAAEKYIEDKARLFDDKVKEIRLGITDRASAIEAILMIQYQLLERFVARFPVARLGARFDPAEQLAKHAPNASGQPARGDATTSQCSGTSPQIALPKLNLRAGPAVALAAVAALFAVRILFGGSGEPPAKSATEPVEVTTEASFLPTEGASQKSDAVATSTTAPSATSSKAPKPELTAVDRGPTCRPETYFETVMQDVSVERYRDEAFNQQASRAIRAQGAVRMDSVFRFFTDPAGARREDCENNPWPTVPWWVEQSFDRQCNKPGEQITNTEVSCTCTRSSDICNAVMTATCVSQVQSTRRVPYTSFEQRPVQVQRVRQVCD
ncbi:MAG: TRAFAC clade GTPase domain-containing protein [Phenylobacterium sp.]